MSKFEKVRLALMDKTKDYNTWVTITENVDARHRGCKYALIGVVNHNRLAIGFKTLDEVIKEYSLSI